MADKAISELVAAEQITATDMFVLEQNGTAKKLTGQILLNWLTRAADGHGGISGIAKVNNSGLVDTYRITMADTNTFDFVVTNGKGISSITKTATSGLVDTYTILYNDGTNGAFTVTNGAKGDPGDTAYVWIKYASQEPTVSSHSFGDVPDDWIGVYFGFSNTAPTNWQEYKWYKIKGEQGDTGDPATLVSATVTYQASDSGTIIPSGVWSDSIPVVAQGKYLWTRKITQFNTGDPIIEYTVSRMGLDGVRGIYSITGNADGSWTIAYNDGATEIISNEAYEALTAQLTQLLAEIAGKEQIAPEFANSVEECTDTSKLYVLPDNMLWAYMTKSVATFTNQLKNAIDTDGTAYNGGKGYKEGWRFNSSKQEVEAEGQLITGYIPYTPGQIIRISGYNTSGNPNGYFQACGSDFSVIMNCQVQQDWGTEPGFTYSEDPTAPGAYVLTIIPANVDGKYTREPLLSDEAKYIRVNISGYFLSALKVTLDEEIAYGYGTTSAWMSTGHAFVPTDYEDRIIDVEKATKTNTEELAAQKQQLAALGSGSDLAIPEYVITEADSVIDRVIAAQGSRTFTFAALTDMHYGVWSYTDGVAHACQALKYISERIELDAVSVLGDYTDGWPDSSYDDAVADFKTVNSVLDDLRFAPNLRLAGNHDIYNENPALTMRYINAYSDDVVWGSRAGGYYYRDFDGYKIRVIGVNTSMLTSEQYNWFVSALDLSGKADVAEWSILVISHHPLDWYTDDEVYRFCYILDGYKNGTSGTAGDISYDFTGGKNAAKLIGNIHGHIHNFKVDHIYLGNVNSGEQTDVIRIATPNACYNRENEYEGAWAEDTKYSKTLNSAKDTSFCIYCIDLDAGTIKAICYGAGIDREISYQYDNDVEPPVIPVMDTETWTFELEDGSTVTKQVVVMV